MPPELPPGIGFNAARGFVGGATMNSSLTPVPLIRFQCRTRLCGWCNKLVNKDQVVVAVFQCRTRLCGWCNEQCRRRCARGRVSFQCRTRLCGWCNKEEAQRRTRRTCVSMPHAALWVVQRGSCSRETSFLTGFNAARGFVGGATASLAALVPLWGKSPFGKSPEI